MYKNDIVTIDGPVASGKTSVAEIVAERIGFKHLSSGLIYRAITYYGIISLGSSFYTSLQVAYNYLSNNPQTIQCRFNRKNKLEIYLSGKLFDAKEVEPLIEDKLSLVAQFNDIRKLINKQIKKLSLIHKLVVDGRDMGSVVFPGAAHKFFLTADLNIRAKRRALQNGVDVNSKDFDSLLEKIKERDLKDATRSVAPLIEPKDAITIDSTNMSFPEVVEKIVKPIESKLT